MGLRAKGASLRPILGCYAFRLSFPIHRNFVERMLESHVPEKRKAMAALKVGEVAPLFDMPAVTGERRHRVRLGDFRGKKNVIIAFYALDWTPT
jgi:hypothetical protein